MARYIPLSTWRKVGTALVGTEIKFSGTATVFVGTTPGASLGSTYSHTEGFIKVPNGDLWIKGFHDAVPATGPVSQVVVRAKSGTLIASDTAERIAPRKPTVKRPFVIKHKKPEKGTVKSMIGKYQSLGLGPNGGQTNAPGQTGGANAWFRTLYPQLGAEMFTGLQRGDGVAMTQISGPLLQGYNTAIDATGITSAIQVGNIPLDAMIMAELKLRGAIDGKLNTLFSSAGGISITVHQEAPATGVNTAWANLRHAVRQFRRQYRERGVPVRFLADILIQGEADSTMSRERYYAEYLRADRDQRRVMKDNGFAYDEDGIPKLIYQTGGYVNNTTHTNGQQLAQLDICRNKGALFAGPIHQFLYADNNVHPITAEEYARMATLGAWALQEHWAGRSWNLYSMRTRVEGNNVFIYFPMKDGETLRNINAKFDAYGGNPNLGFTHSTRTVTEVELNCGAPGGVRVKLNGAPTGTLRLGRQVGDLRASAVGQLNYSASRVGIGTTLTSNSLLYPGQVAERVLPSESWVL